MGVEIMQEYKNMFPYAGSDEDFSKCHQLFKNISKGRVSVGKFVNICLEYIKIEHTNYFDPSDPRYTSCGKFGRQTRRVSAAKNDLLSLIRELF